MSATVPFHYGAWKQLQCNQLWFIVVRRRELDIMRGTFVVLRSRTRLCCNFAGVWVLAAFLPSSQASRTGGRQNISFTADACGWTSSVRLCRALWCSCFLLCPSFSVSIQTKRFFLCSRRFWNARKGVPYWLSCKQKAYLVATDVG